MSIDTATVQRWLDAYSQAWISYDPDEIGALFSEDAEYRYHPWDEGDDVLRGREQIVANWLENRDKPGTYRGEYHPLLVSGDGAITVGVSNYYSDETQTTLERAYHNLWVLSFTDDGQCRSYTEWYMEAPRK
ncbi:MAG TPA: nuclear transport factor 2 family protein [Ktedonobacterales bacterium]|nr:nuclear transport factor 2 family protein [Ktedonobacterales bacterium]